MSTTSTDIECDGNLHAIPHADLIEHIESRFCICMPTAEVITGDDGVMLFYKHHGLNGARWEDTL